jgi:hypothetical protein
MAETWDRVAYPEFARGAGRKLDPTDMNEGTTPWVDAPATSHCHSFRLFSAAKGSKQRSFLMKFGGGESTIQIKFRGKDGEGINAKYGYMMTDHEQAERVFKALCESEHPYSLVVIPDLIEAKVPYTRISGVV